MTARFSKISFALLLVIMSSCVNAQSFLKDYGPFQKGESPPSVPLTECILLKSQYKAGDTVDDPSVLYFVVPHDSKKRTLKLEQPNGTNSYESRITVLDSKGRPLSPPATNEMLRYVNSVKCADLNQDGQTDFIVNLWSGGCGLGAEGSTTTFLMSSGTRYVATNFYSFGFGPEDILQLKKGGSCYFIHNAFIQNWDEKTKDGRDHSFWVYQLYRFKGSEMVKANGDDPRFPKWVWYTIKENHRETDQLTTKQKKRLLKAHYAQQGN